MNEMPVDNDRTANKANRKDLFVRGMLVLAGLLVVALGLMIGLNVGGLREELLWKISPPRIESIAVLPVENLSKDPAQAYLAQAMTSLLINDMGRIKAVRVTASSSVVQYRKAPKPFPEIARELNIDAIVEAGVMRSGDRIQLTANLIHAATKRRIWGQSYERELRDLPSLPGELCREIAYQIDARLTPPEEALLSSRAAVNPQALDTLMQGMWGGNPAKTEQYLRQVVQLDPSYAAGYDYMAQMYSMRTMYPTLVAPKDIYPKASEAAQKAISLNPDVFLSHRVLATVAMEYDWDFAQAEKEFKLALQFAPHGSNAHHMYSHYLLSIGRIEEARVETQRAIEVDPMNPTLFACLSWHDVMVGKHEEAENRALQAISLGAPDQLARLTLGWSYALRSRHDEAIAEFQKAVVGWKGAVFPTAALGHAYAVAGKQDAAREVLNGLLERFKNQKEYVSPYEIAMIYAGLGDKDRAFEWLEKAYDERASLLVYFRMDPRIWSLRSDPRHQELLRRMNFPL